MKRIALLLVALALACSTNPIVVDEQTRGAIKQLTDAIAQQPANMPWIYVLATYHDKAGQTDQVVRWLTRLDELGWQHGVSPIAFKNSRGSTFRSIVAKLDVREPRVNNATVAFTIAGQRDLAPEGIGYDPIEDTFYVSGIHRRKVIRVDPSGRATDFVKEGQDGMLGGLGI